jgi:hypothetical protein
MSDYVIALPNCKLFKQGLVYWRRFLREERSRHMFSRIRGTHRGLLKSCLTRRVSAVLLFGQAICLTGCGGAPSVTIAGAYFPAWLLCAIIAVVAAVFVRVLMVATGLANFIPFQLAVCCSVGAILGLMLWNLWVVH